MRTWITALAAIALGGCGSSPVGEWEGMVEFLADDGNVYVNEMSVDGDGSADLTLYVLLPSEDGSEFLIGQSDFVAEWEKDGGEFVFALACDWEDCEFDPTMTCAFDDDGDGMTCDMSPDFYVDDEEILQWVPVE